MYRPAAFTIAEAESLEWIDATGVATLVSHDSERGFDSSVVPLLRDGDCLLGHVARANPIWRAEGAVLALFAPVDGYVSPAWYPSKQEHGRVVPTWNYVSIAVHGTLRAVEDAAWLRSLVGRLTDVHEQRVGSDWSIDDPPDGFVDGLLRSIVGIEITIDRIEGKAKLSQNRSIDDVAGVIAHHDDALGTAMSRAADRGRP